MSELILNFDPQLTEVSLEYEKLLRAINFFSNCEAIDEDSRDFLLVNLMNHKDHFDRIIKQSRIERAAED